MAGISSIGAAGLGAPGVLTPPYVLHYSAWSAAGVFDKALTLPAVFDMAIAFDVPTEPET